MTRGGRFAAPAMAAVLLLLFAAPALAADRFAEPNGDGAFPCLNTDPCSIETAVSTAQSGDNVVPFGGTYNVSTTLELPVGASLNGGAGVVINSTASTAIRTVASSPSSTVTQVTLNHTPSGSPTAGLELLAGTAMQMSVTSSGDSACVITGAITTALMRESVCHNTSPGPGVAVNSFSAVDSNAEIFDVTAVSDNGYGLFASATAPNADVNLTGGNVIAQGGTTDQRGFNPNTTSTSSTISLTNSNFDTLDFTPPTGATGTLPAENANQSDPPLLDATFHELPGSPTINAGNVFLQSAFIDIDGDDRPQGAAMDIGADEVEGDPPDTTIDAKPPKHTSKRTARFKFSSTEPSDATFECKLDDKPFKPCESPKKYRNLKPGKRHHFQVRATDGFLNTDETPAKYSWKVRR
jgi:hypothetical protein